MKDNSEEQLTSNNIQKEEAEKTLHKLLYAPINKDEKEKRLIEFVINIPRDTKLDLRLSYNRKYPETGLIVDIENKLTGNFRYLLSKLFLTRYEFEVKLLMAAFKDYPLNDEVIYEILLNRSYVYLEGLKRLYLKTKGKPIEEDIKKYFTEPISTAIIKIITTNRRTNVPLDSPYCKSLAEKLFEIGSENWITHPESLQIFSENSFEEILLISRHYLEISGENILRTIDRLCLPYKRFFICFMFYSINPAEILADNIYRGKYNKIILQSAIERVLLIRYDFDFQKIKYYLEGKHQVTFKELVEKLSGSNYQSLLLRLSECINEDSIEDVPNSN